MQTFEEAKKHCEKSMRNEWEDEKQRILDSLVGPDEELEIPSEREVCLCVRACVCACLLCASVRVHAVCVSAYVCVYVRVCV